MVASAAKGPTGLQSVLNALELLDCFTIDEELGVSALARRLGVAKSTVHRLLTTLCSHGYTERNPETGQYRLGLRLHELGTLAIGRHNLRQAAMPLIEELRERTGNTIHLTIADGPDVVQLERLETVRSMPLFSGVARRHPVHSTAGGKAIAAFEPVFATARINVGFPAFTRSTIRTVADFEREIRDVRRRGFAINHDENRVGLTSVAVPVRTRSGRALAAISIVGPTADAERHLERHARLAQLAATKTAQTLGM